MTTPTPAQPQPALTYASCKVCVIRLEHICYRRAWWFRPFREVLATGIRIFALVYRVPVTAYAARSKMCYGCLRFRKNAVKQHSRLFNYFDGYLNPFFNRVRDSLLTPEELNWARTLAARAADQDFVTPDPPPAPKGGAATAPGERR